MDPSRRELLAGAIISAAAAPFASAAAPNTSLSAAAWQDDLGSLLDQLRRTHRDLFHHTPETEFQAAIESLRRRIPSLRPWQIVAGIQSIVAMAGDGHTFLFAKDLYRSFPFETFWFGDEIRVIRAAPILAPLLGARIERIDRMPMDEVGRRLDTVIPQAETSWYVLGQRPDRLRRAELLAALGVTKSPDRMTVEAVDSAGRHLERVIEPLALGTPDEPLSLAVGPALPDRPYPGFAWRRLEGRDAVHLDFRSYEALPERAAALFGDLRASPPQVLLIDLRQNTGGNYTLPRDHIIAPLQDMPALNRAGRLYVLIGRRTFSAAMTNATDFRRETEALLVGEPAGARPNGFQELKTFTLPNSGLKVGCSTASYRFGAPGETEVDPDLAAPPDWTSFSQGRDSAIEAALARSGF